MSDPNAHNMPPLEGGYQPTHAEVLGRVANGTFLEMATGPGDPVEPIYVDTQPRGEGGVWIGPDGELVHSFMNKFEPGFEGWKPGEVVRARFVVDHRGTGARGLLVADSYIGDIRYADTFTLPDDDLPGLAGMGVAEVDADVEVTSPGEYCASQSFTYSARIRRINAVQEPWDGETAPQAGEQVLLQGQVVQYIPNKPGYQGIVQVQLANGRSVPVHLTQGHIVYEGGNVELLYPNSMQEGDVVQINATALDTPDPAGPGGRATTLHASWCRSSYLLQPSAERQETHEAHRADIAARIEALGPLEGEAFRNAYGELLRAHVVFSNEPPHDPHILITEREQRALQTLVDQKFPNDARGNPSPHRPLTSTEHILHISKPLRDRGSTVYGMSRAEFYAFCLDVANGRDDVNRKHELRGDTPTWLLDIGDGELSDAEQFEIWRQAAERWISFVTGKEPVISSRQADPERQASFAHRAMSRNLVSVIARVGRRLPQAKEYLYGQTIRTLRGITTQDPTQNLAEYDIARELCEGLVSIARATGVWENFRYVGVTDFAGLQDIVERLPELATITQQLEDKGHLKTAESVTEAMNHILHFSSQPPYAIS